MSTIKATLQLDTKQTDGIQATMTVTMSLYSWKAVRDGLKFANHNGSYHAHADLFARTIDELVEKAERQIAVETVEQD